MKYQARLSLSAEAEIEAPTLFKAQQIAAGLGELALGDGIIMGHSNKAGQTVDMTYNRSTDLVIVPCCSDCGEPLDKVIIERFAHREFVVDWHNNRLTPVAGSIWEINDWSYHCANCDSLNVNDQLGNVAIKSSDIYDGKEESK